MKHFDANSIGDLTKTDIALLAKALQRAAKLRVFDIQLSQGRVWIKQFLPGDVTWKKKLHAWFSTKTKTGFMKSSMLVTPEEMIAREKRKYEAFSKAGIPVPEIIWSNETVLVLSDEQPNLMHELEKAQERNDQERTDELLTKFGFAMADIHQKGLCHGRPHTRDAYLAGDGIGFIDFEEEPEAVMPLSHAQARDFWLSMLHICAWNSSKEVHDQVFERWIASVDPETVKVLKKINGVFTPFVGVAKAVPEKWRGSDMKLALTAVEFLDKAFDRTSI